MPSRPSTDPLSHSSLICLSRDMRSPALKLKSSALSPWKSYAAMQYGCPSSYKAKVNNNNYFSRDFWKLAYQHVNGDGAQYLSSWLEGRCWLLVRRWHDRLNCSIIKVTTKVIGMNTWRGWSSDGHRKLAEMVRTSHGTAERCRYETGDQKSSITDSWHDNCG